MSAFLPPWRRVVSALCFGGVLVIFDVQVEPWKLFAGTMLGLFALDLYIAQELSDREEDDA